MQPLADDQQETAHLCPPPRQHHATNSRVPPHPHSLRTDCLRFSSMQSSWLKSVSSSDKHLRLRISHPVLLNKWEIFLGRSPLPIGQEFAKTRGTSRVARFGSNAAQRHFGATRARSHDAGSSVTYQSQVTSPVACHPARSNVPEAYVPVPYC